MSTAWNILLASAVLAFLVLIGVMLVRAVQGPETADRILAINMISTMVICIILILSLLLEEA